jgi:endonuclease III
MAATPRSTQFTRLHKILKKHYAPVAPDPNRSVLEHLLFAACLENAHYRVAEEMFGALVHTFFDWNEIRVSSVRELSEVLSGLPDPAAAGLRVKRILQHIFEATYAFDLEDLRKQNLSAAVERLEKIEGTTKFSVAYVIQSALGGHAIPIDSGTANALRVVDLATDADVAAGVIPGLERAIPKTSGIEFGSLLHQLGADFTASPYSPALHAILLEIDPGAKARLPSRRGPKRVAAEPGEGSAEGTDETKVESAAAKAPASKSGKASAAKTAPAEAQPAVSKPAAPQPTADKTVGGEPPADAKIKSEPSKRKSPGEQGRGAAVASETEQAAAKPQADQPEGPVGAEKKKAPTSAKKPATKKKPDQAHDKGPAEEPPREASAAEGISKRKPR